MHKLNNHAVKENHAVAFEDEPPRRQSLAFTPNLPNQLVLLCGPTKQNFVSERFSEEK